MVVLESEIGTAMDINTLQWHKHAIATQNEECPDFRIYMGLCSSDQLSSGSFEENYISGTKTLVYSTDLLTLSKAVEWVEIELDSSFPYNGSDNLIIEISWDNGTVANEYKCHEWYAGADRSLHNINQEGIVSHPCLPHMIISGSPQALENSTFASIKVKLGF